MKKDSDNPKKLSDNAYLQFTGLAIQMILIIVGGIYLGKFLDGKFNPNKKIYTGLCTLFAVFITLIYTIKQAIKILNKQEKKDDKKDK